MGPEAPCHNKREAENPITVRLPDGSTIQSTHVAHLHLPHLPPEATETHIFPSLGNTHLLSIGKLCDADCDITFSNTEATIKRHGEVILRGTRSKQAPKLWNIELPKEPATETMYAAIAVNQSTKPADMVAFSHATLFSPPLTTLAAALCKGFLIGFPSLTKVTLAKYPPQSIATIKGHLDQSRVNRKRSKSIKQERQTNPSDPDEDIHPSNANSNANLNANSNTNSSFPSDEELELDWNPASDAPNVRTHYCYAAVIDLNTGQIYTDQTGRFPIPSSNGMNNLFCLYDYDSNLVESIPTMDRTAPAILKGYQNAFKTLQQSGLSPKLAKLDNECSKALKEFIVEEEATFELAPPYIHRSNAAERAIRTFKNHFIAGLSTCDKDFPLHLWDKLVPQANLTLNLLRASRINPKLSAYAQVFGAYNYNAHPIGPPGTLVMIHEKPNQRKTWARHAIE